MTITFFILFLAINGISAGRLKRLVGGEPISLEEAPYFVSIQKKCLHYCGGSLITSRHVLSAGHCFPDDIGELDDYQYSVVVGSEKRNTGGTCHTIKSVIRLDTYRHESLLDDVAVVVLSEIVKIGPTVNVISLPTEAPELPDEGTVIGFKTDRDRFKPVRLHQLEVEMWTTEFCWNRERSFKYRNHGQICGFHSCSTEAVYRGDSGGPLVYEEAIVGITSWVGTKGECNSYFADVYFYDDFIRNATGLSKK